LDTLVATYFNLIVPKTYFDTFFKCRNEAEDDFIPSAIC